MKNLNIIQSSITAYSAHWSGSNVELEKITQANNLYGCLGIGLRYSEIL